MGGQDHGQDQQKILLWSTVERLFEVQKPTSGTYLYLIGSSEFKV